MMVQLQAKGVEFGYSSSLRALEARDDCRDERFGKVDLVKKRWMTNSPSEAEEEYLELSEELDQVLSYHQATKHCFTKMAPGPKAMDWPNEPRPAARAQSTTSPVLTKDRTPAA